MFDEAIAAATKPAERACGRGVVSRLILLV